MPWMWRIVGSLGWNVGSAAVVGHELVAPEARKVCGGAGSRCGERARVGAGVAEHGYEHGGVEGRLFALLGSVTEFVRLNDELGL